MKKRAKEGRIYIDTCILVSYFAEDEAEVEKKTQAIKCLDYLASLQDVVLCTSEWSITEFVKVMVLTKGMPREKVATIEQDFVNKRRVGKNKIDFLDVDPHLEGYDYREFFYDIRRGFLQYNSGYADVVHSVIMKNNGLDTILTFDAKNDFKQIPNFTVLHPSAVIEGMK